MPTKDRIPYGIDALPGRFKCADCGYEISLAYGRPLPPCPRFDDFHDKRSWKPLAKAEGTEPFSEERYPVHKRKETAILLAMRIIETIIATGASIQVESLRPSRNPETLRRQLESFSSGAFVRVAFASGSTGYFDILYKCQWPVAVVEYSDNLQPAVEACISEMFAGETRRDQKTVLTAANSFLEPGFTLDRPAQERQTVR